MPLRRAKWTKSAHWKLNLGLLCLALGLNVLHVVQLHRQAKMLERECEHLAILADESDEFQTLDIETRGGFMLCSAPTSQGFRLEAVPDGPMRISFIASDYPEFTIEKMIRHLRITVLIFLMISAGYLIAEFGRWRIVMGIGQTALMFLLVFEVAVTIGWHLL